MISALADHADPASCWQAIERIFFLTATGIPADATPAERQRQLARWTGYYREAAPEKILLHVSDDGAITGYLMGCRDSRGAARLYDDIPYYGEFEDLFDAFPAHFHVNCHPDSQRNGHGAALVAAFVAAMRRAGAAGVHVVTSVAAENDGFYRACGFSVVGERSWRDGTLLCLGRAIEPA